MILIGSLNPIGPRFAAEVAVGAGMTLLRPVGKLE